MSLLGIWSIDPQYFIKPIYYYTHVGLKKKKKMTNLIKTRIIIYNIFCITAFMSMVEIVEWSSYSFYNTEVN